MEWFNLFLDLQFLTTDYIYYLKQISIICVFATIIFLFTYVIGDAVKHVGNGIGSAFGEDLNDILKMGSLIAFIVALFTFAIVFLGFFIFPAAYFAGVLKDLFVAKYFYNPELLTIARELVINLLMSFVSAFCYMHIVGWIWNNFIEENSK